MKKALFPGTFDPFTIGHADIVERALPLFDHIVIGIGVNEEKTPADAVEKRAETIRNIYKDEPRVSVLVYDGLTVDTCQREGIDFLLRGVRSMRDFEYERDVAAANKQLAGIETILLFSNERLAHISSSLVRELKKYGRDVSEFLPKTMI